MQIAWITSYRCNCLRHKIGAVVVNKEKRVISLVSVFRKSKRKSEDENETMTQKNGKWKKGHKKEKQDKKKRKQEKRRKGKRKK